jgi:DNA topoisomerase VI subunit B
VADAIHHITGKSRDGIKRDFLKVAEQVTEADLAEQDAKLEEASKAITTRPRRRDEEAE